MKIKPLQVTTLFALIGLDALTKVATETLIGYGKSVTVIPDFFWLTVLRNTGAAWSLFEGMRWIFVLISLIAVSAMLLLYLKAKPEQKLYQWALVFLIAGTFGNFMDRLLLGYVRDFLSFNLFGYMFPVFNVADTALNIGVFLLILEALLETRKPHGTL